LRNDLIIVLATMIEDTTIKEMRLPSE